MRTLYFDCFAGASGNMILGALVSAGADRAAIKKELDKLGLAGLSITGTSVRRAGIDATLVQVETDDRQNHRHLTKIEQIINDAELPASVKTRSIGIFRRLGAAEAKVHNIPLAKVHFHEVGALDAIADIVGSCIAIEMLKIERFVSSPINVGHGRISIQHGTYPVPPPAVAELLIGVPVISEGPPDELTTPTGAAIITTLCSTYSRLPEIVPERIGYGAGTRDYELFPNVLRVFVGETVAAADESEQLEEVFTLETNIDDELPQTLGYVMQRAFELGALDCWFTPIQMKKNRPASMLSILCRGADMAKFTDLLYRETTTLGIRVSKTRRSIADRQIVLLETVYGTVNVKVARRMGEIVNVMPEYEDIARIALERGVPLTEVRDEVAKTAADKLKITTCSREKYEVQSRS